MYRCVLIPPTPEDVANFRARREAEVFAPGPGCRNCGGGGAFDNARAVMNYVKTASGWNAQVNGGWQPVTNAAELAALNTAAALFVVTPAPVGTGLVGDIVNGAFGGFLNLLRAKVPYPAPSAPSAPPSGQ